MKYINGFGIVRDRYVVCKTGRVKDLKSGEWKTVHDNGNGYKTVGIYSKGLKGTRMFYIHRLVAEEFCEKSEGREHVNHKDGNKDNNHYSNLEWVTPSENTRHGIKGGTVNRANRTEGTYRRISQEEIEEAVRLICSGHSIRESAELLNTYRGTLNTILNSRSRFEDIKKAFEGTPCEITTCKCVKYRKRAGMYE